MVELNDCEPKPIKVLGPYTFSIGETSNLSPYSRGGIVTQVKMPKQVNFKPLKDSIKEPEFLIADFAKFDYPPQLHLAFASLHKFIEQNNRKPKPWNQEDADEFLKLVKTQNITGSADEEINSDVLQLFAKTCAGDLNPINAIIGGVVAQEVMKACSGKFMPIYQWMYFDAVECLPADLTEITEEDCTPILSRYDGQTAVFGRTFHKKLGK